MADVDATTIATPLCLCTGGLLAIALAPPARAGDRPAVFAGGGDGVVRKIEGYDMRWKLSDETSVNGAVVALSFVHGGDELLVGTDSGRTYRLLAGDLGQPASPLTTSHVGVPMGVAFGSRADVFATCADDGEVIVWDLSDYNAIATTKHSCVVPRGKTAQQPADGAKPRRIARFGDGATCLCWVTDVAVVVGYGDCHVRCFNASDGSLEWAIPTAHREPISAIACHVEAKLAYLVTGSKQSSTRVIQCPFNMSVLEATREGKASTLRVRPER